MEAVTLKLTSAIVLDGEVVRRDRLVEVDEAMARNLLHRGKAVLATEEDGAAPAPAKADKPAGNAKAKKAD